tara:strand:+ start:301 stop:444 length:144 start_codon:yes stop_codon:yes gene_type:complete
MIKLLLVLSLLLVGCGNSKPHAGNAEFDAHLKKLMDKPYNPEKGSIY